MIRLHTAILSGTHLVLCAPEIPSFPLWSIPAVGLTNALCPCTRLLASSAGRPPGTASKQCPRPTDALCELSWSPADLQAKTKGNGAVNIVAQDTVASKAAAGMASPTYEGALHAGSPDRASAGVSTCADIFKMRAHVGRVR